MPLASFLTDISASFETTVTVKGISSEERRALCRETESYLSHRQTSKHQCTRLGSVPNLNSQANRPFKLKGLLT